MSNLKHNIEHAFREHRIVFWYDDGNNNEEEFNELELDAIEKVKVEGNEFALKYRLLREEPETKFLLYFPNAKPVNEDNWLLDIELSNKLYESDEESIFLQEMGWEYRFKKFVEQHIEFFKSKARRQKLNEIFNKNDSFDELRRKMIALVFGTENYDLMSLIQVYANSYIVGNLEKIEAKLERYQLKQFIWQQIQEKFDYKNKDQNIYEFIIDVFDRNFVLGNDNGLHIDTRLILSRWRDSITLRESYLKMSDKVAQVLNVEDKLQNTTVDKIEEDELFTLTDQKIIYDLVAEIDEHNISSQRLHEILKNRESKFWYNDYKDLYQAIEKGYRLLNKINHSKFEFKNTEEAIKEYSSSLYEIDYLYRKFYFHYQSANPHNIINRLATKVEKAYVNKWLFERGNDFQALLNKKKKWDFNNITSQRNFFKEKVEPIITKQKLFVIISDAFRYECGIELHNAVNKMNKFHSEIDFMVSSLPSYTQLGMASLLPNKTLAFNEKSDTVLVDGQSASGTNNRKKILATINKKVNAIQSDEFVKMNSTERSNFVRDHEVVYLYHNQIDKVGDDKMTENEVFKASQQEIDYLIELIKSLTSANASRILITADHGYLYQAEKVNENDFLSPEYTGDTFKENRRFVLGENLLAKDKNALKFKAKDLYINSDVDVLIAKSINRFKVKGAGSQFVHGGATLQEIIVPILDITKGRKDDIVYANIDITQGNNKITTNILPVKFYQEEAVSDKVLPREIKAYIQAENGVILSDQLVFTFDFTDEDVMNRTHKYNFQLEAHAGDKYKKQTVKLMLMVQIEGTSRWQKYKEYSYQLDISFTTDF